MAASAQLARIAESVGRDFPAVLGNDREALQGNPKFSHVPGGTRRMAVAVDILQFFSGNVAVLQDVVDDRLRTFASDCAEPGEERFRELFSHTRQV